MRRKIIPFCPPHLGLCLADMLRAARLHGFRTEVSQAEFVALVVQNIIERRRVICRNNQADNLAQAKLYIGPGYVKKNISHR